MPDEGEGFPALPVILDTRARCQGTRTLAEHAGMVLNFYPKHGLWIISFFKYIEDEELGDENLHRRSKNVVVSTTVL